MAAMGSPAGQFKFVAAKLVGSNVENEGVNTGYVLPLQGVSWLTQDAIASFERIC